MNQPRTQGGPVSAALEAELARTLRARGVVVWLDLDNSYETFVQRLAQENGTGDFPGRVIAFTGSHLEVISAMEPLAGGLDPPLVVLHMPGFNEESVSASPQYEWYAAGARFRKSLPTLVREAAAGKVAAERIEAWVAGSGWTLDAADAWLAAEMNEDEGPLGQTLGLLTPGQLFDDLVNGGAVSALLQDAAASQTVWKKLTSWLGMPEHWKDRVLPGHSQGTHPRDVAFSMLGWAMCVEYVDDLRGREPVHADLIGIRKMARLVMDSCRALASAARDRAPEFYSQTANEIETFLADEVKVGRAEDLGKIDTFRFEDDRVLEAALDALTRQDWNIASDWADARLGKDAASTSFWLQYHPERSMVWRLVRAAAACGQALVAAGASLGKIDGLEDAVSAYVKRGAAVDQTHRHLEQCRLSLLQPQLPHFERLRGLLDQVRGDQLRWADAWAREFNAACTRNGFLPAPALRQRELFNEVVYPLTREKGPTAFFVVDALRYEMGVELFGQLQDTHNSLAKLEARLAELPTLTEVGMNVLAPVSDNGRLRPVFKTDREGILGFFSGEFQVTTPETRRKAMHQRAGGHTCLWLTPEEVLQRTSADLKRAVVQCNLVVVHSTEIDVAGESGGGLPGFDSALQKLKAAWHILRESGVCRFVITADHGFLLTGDRSRPQQTRGRKTDPGRRHVFTTVAADATGEVRVPLASLGWENTAESVVFPESTAVFDTGKKPSGFVHGGNSLQERVIPVITLMYRAPLGGGSQQYGIAALEKEGVLGMHCLEISVSRTEQRSLDFGDVTEIDLAMRVPQDPGVRVELCQTRGAARLLGGVVFAKIGKPFELFFRLTGTSELRVEVELHHSGAGLEVTPCRPGTRFAVTAGAGSALEEKMDAGEWLERITHEGFRRVFEHLKEYGAVTESEVLSMLKTARELRRFAREFDELAKMAPFVVRIEMNGEEKRYVRQGETK